ncbi:putative disease resistance protein At4g19050 isoform X2 [Coffea arabica]
MDQNSVELKVTDVLELLKTRKVVLSGKSGTGKTWMARKVGLLAVKNQDVHSTLWISLSVEHDEMALYEHIANQLSVFSTHMELEDEDINKVEDIVGKKETLDELKEKVCMRLSADGGPQKILVILDDEGSKMKEGDGDLNKVLQFIQQHLKTIADGDGEQKLKV